MTMTKRSGIGPSSSAEPIVAVTIDPADYADAISADDPIVLEHAAKWDSDPQKVANVFRGNAARDEAKALKEWQRTGLGERPSTPNLNYLKAGITMKSTTKKGAAAVVVPRPTPGRGFAVVELKSDKHAEIVRKALGNVRPDITGKRWLTVPNAEVETDVRLLGEWASASDHIYDARLAVATMVMLRRANPKAADTKRGATTLLVNALNERLSDDFDWGVSIKVDGTLSFFIDSTKTGRVENGARGIAATLGIALKSDAPAPAPKPTTKAAKKSTPAKAAAKKATAAKAPPVRRVPPKRTVAPNFKGSKKPTSKAS